MKTEINPQLKIPEKDYSKLPRLSLLETGDCQKEEVGWEPQKRVQELGVINGVMPTLRMFADAWRSTDDKIEEDRIDSQSADYITKMMPLIDCTEVSLFYRKYNMLKYSKRLAIN